MTHTNQIRFIIFLLQIIPIISLVADFEVNITFPENYHSQGIKVYQGGEILHTNVSGHTISFFIKDMSRTKEFYLLVVKPCNLSYVFNEVAKNTVQYRAVAPGKSYKFYRIKIASSAISQPFTIETITLEENQKIPDQTVIIFYNPEYIESLFCSKENSILTLSVIKDLFDVSGGEDMMYYEEILYLFDTIHTDTLQHKPIYKITLAKNHLCKQVIGI